MMSLTTVQNAPWHFRRKLCVVQNVGENFAQNHIMDQNFLKSGG